MSTYTCACCGCDRNDTPTTYPYGLICEQCHAIPQATKELAAEIRDEFLRESENQRGHRI